MGQGAWSQFGRLQLRAPCSLLRARLRRTARSVGEGLAAGEAGGEVEGEEAFADAGVADEERDFADRDAAGPEPVDVARADVGEAEGAIAGACWQVVDGFLSGRAARFFVRWIEGAGVWREEVGGVDVVVDLERSGEV